MILFYYLSNLVLLSGLVLLYWRQQKRQLPALKKIFFPALAFKLLCGVLAGIFYRHYYGYGDTFQYQSQSLFLYDYFLDSPLAYLRLWLTNRFESETVRTSMIFVWYSNSYFMVIVLSLFNILTGGHYFLNALYFSLFSFFGTWQLVGAVARVYPAWWRAAAAAFLFFPSAVFWSAGIAKEAVYMGALCWFLAGVLNLFSGSSRAWQLAGLLAAGYLLWKIKFYFAAVIFPLAFSYAWLRWAADRFPALQSLRNQLLGFAALLLVSGLVVSQMHVVFKLDYFLTQLIHSYQEILAGSAGKPVLVFPDLKPTLGSVLAHAPQAAWQAALRPFIWEGDTWVYKLAGLENLLVSALLVRFLVQLVKNKDLGLDWFWCILLFYCLVVAALIGLSTPNLGSLSRYKTAFQPFLVFLLFTNFPWHLFANSKRKEGFVLHNRIS
jgi:hypothetical protein